MAREQRKLAAIVAADVVGYSRLMGRDESGTLARLRKNRSEHLEPVLARYGGRLVKLTGDGALIEFGSAVDALSAAIEFQQAMAEANSDQPADAALVFRMGLNRATFAALQLLEAVGENCWRGGPITVEASFDEFNLDIRVMYQGEALEFPDKDQTTHHREPTLELPPNRRLTSNQQMRQSLSST